MDNPQRSFFLMAYDGTDFHGWQRQRGVKTVQETVENALKTLSGINIETTGCGRTDAGVHASGFVFHADIPKGVFPDAFPLKNLNGLLPLDIRVFQAARVDASMHARFSANLRRYRYYINTVGSPFRRNYAWFYPYPLDLAAMNNAAKFFIGTHRFEAFCKAHGAANSGICTVHHAEWSATKQGDLVFTVSANRFLRNMVRAMVGTLIEAGSGKRSPDSMATLLKEGNRRDAGASVPAKGLFLEEVRYDKPIFNFYHD